MAAKIIRLFPRYLCKEANTSSNIEQQRRLALGYFAILRYWRKAACKRNGRVATRCLYKGQLSSRRRNHILSDKRQKPAIKGNNRH
jgi:hypothetical protein